MDCNFVLLRTRTKTNNTVSISLKHMSVCRTVSEIISVKKRGNLETGGRGRSRSLKTAPFDRSYTTFYWSAIVSTAPSYTVFELCDVE